MRAVSPPSNPLTDHDRPTAAAAGRQLGDFYARHGRMVLGVCRLILRDPDEAEDAAQQTFLSAYGALLDGSTARDAAAWLGTIARNECRTRLRALERAPLALTDDAPPTPDAHTVASGREDAETVLRALSNLSERQREAVILRSLYGLSYREVAKALGTSVAGVETLLFRGRRRLSEVTRPQLAAAHALLVLPLALKAELAQLVPGFEAGATSGGAKAVGIAGGALGIGIAGTAGGGGGSGIAGLLGAPVAARIVGVITAATIGIAAAPTVQSPAGGPPRSDAAMPWAGAGNAATQRTGGPTDGAAPEPGVAGSPSPGAPEGVDAPSQEGPSHRRSIPEGDAVSTVPSVEQPAGTPPAAPKPATDDRRADHPKRDEEERDSSHPRPGDDDDDARSDRRDGDSTDTRTEEPKDDTRTNEGADRDSPPGDETPDQPKADEPTVAGPAPDTGTTTTPGEVTKTDPAPGPAPDPAPPPAPPAAEAPTDTTLTSTTP